MGTYRRRPTSLCALDLLALSAPPIKQTYLGILSLVGAPKYVGGGGVVKLQPFSSERIGRGEMPLKRRMRSGFAELLNFAETPFFPRAR